MLFNIVADIAKLGLFIGPVDKAILWFVRDRVPAALNGFFAVVTFSGQHAAVFALPNRRCRP